MASNDGNGDHINPQRLFGFGLQQSFGFGPRRNDRLVLDCDNLVLDRDNDDDDASTITAARST